MNRKGKALVAILVICLVAGSSFLLLERGKEGFVSYTRYPDFLLLSNWVNSTLWVSTGNEDPYFPGYNLSVQAVYDGAYGLLPVKVFVLSGGSVTGATLTPENEVLVNQTSGITRLIYPPGRGQFFVHQERRQVGVKYLVTVSSSSPPRYLSQGFQLWIFTKPAIYLFSRNATFLVSYSGGELEVLVKIPSQNGTLLTSIGGAAQLSWEEAEKLDDKEVGAWLNSSRVPDLSGELLKEYYISLLVLKDDQNPYLGCFAASPSPVYLYAWVRDGSFSAMALADAGHLRSAEKYWEWMAGEMIPSGPQNGTWYTRYDFWDGLPDLSWAPTEYDSIGLFQLGVWNYYAETGNTAFARRMLPYLNRSIAWEADQIRETGLIPEDASVWEDDHAYNFWTEAFDDVGIRDTAYLYSSLGLKASGLYLLAEGLNQSMRPFYTADGFAQYALPGPSGLVAYDVPDSSLIAPIDYGYVQPLSQYAVYTVNYAESHLTVEGGLARSSGDSYHYGWDSTGKMPPWIITTLFLALYDEEIGNHTAALDLLVWCASHSQSGLLPEALDPNYGNPLPTTSPLTWSSAMYVLASLGYRPGLAEA